VIRTEAEYQGAHQRLDQDRQVVQAQEQALKDAGLSAEEVMAGMEPLLAFQAQLQEEVVWYEDVSRGHLPTVTRLTDMGRLLIALRIASGLTQRQLADKLGVSESAVSRDERNEYHGVTAEQAQRIGRLTAARPGLAANGSLGATRLSR
jgi:DNA-directed RNA polymerase specialized sigma subunit